MVQFTIARHGKIRKYARCWKTSTQTIRAHGNLPFGGDKGYPYIGVPKGWSLYITKSGEDELEEEQEEGEGKRTKRRPITESRPHLICTPKIAKHRSVVERVFGAMKQWQILASTQCCSVQKHVHEFVTIIATLKNLQGRY